MREQLNNEHTHVHNKKGRIPMKFIWYQSETIGTEPNAKKIIKIGLQLAKKSCNIDTKKKIQSN